MIAALRNNVPSIDLTPGEQIRDFIYIDDVVNAYQTVIQKISEVPNLYKSFQVSTKRLISIKELIIYLKEITGSSTVLNFGAIPYRKNEIMHSTSDNSALLALGWKPIINIEKGIQLILEINK